MKKLSRIFVNTGFRSSFRAGTVRVCRGEARGWAGDSQVSRFFSHLIAPGHFKQNEK